MQAMMSATEPREIPGMTFVIGRMMAESEHKIRTEHKNARWKSMSVSSMHREQI